MSIDFDFHRDVEPLLPGVLKPARYTGGEFNETVKPTAAVRIALAYPDVYEIGMSNLGLRILYESVNRLDFAAAERVYLPWPDLEKLLGERQLPLFTLESKRPVRECDMLGITLQYELTYTNILELLRQSGIPLFAAERGEDDPIVIGGGPCVYNPAPLAPFFDLFLLGDGDLAVQDIAGCLRKAKQEGSGRVARIAALAEVAGVFDPAKGIRGRRRVEKDLDLLPCPIRQLVPNLQTIQDRGLIEVSRGCSNGCRFCHAGMTYRPVRERTAESIEKIAGELVKATGFRELTLASLSVSDYTNLPGLIGRLNRRFGNAGISFSLPSLRIESFTLETPELLAEIRKSGLTFAVEAGTDGLRRRLNKPIDEERFFSVLQKAVESGWSQVKLYLMFGFPDAGDEREAICAFVDRLLARFPRLALKLNVGMLVPKPHTPLQWAAQMPVAEAHRVLAFLRERYRRGRVRLSWHQPEMGLLEGMLARGDGRVARVLHEAHRLGARFDAWDEHFNFGIWQQAMATVGISEAEAASPFGGALDAPLPWDGIGGVPDRAFLAEEYRRYVSGEGTPDCRSGEECPSCRVCGSGLQPKMAPEEGPLPAAEPQGDGGGDSGPAGRFVYRLEFDKSGLFRFVSHLDLQTHLGRALFRSGLPLSLSEGFNPKPRLVFAAPLSLGIAGLGDLVELELSQELPAAAVSAALEPALPGGFRLRRVRRLPVLKSGITGAVAAHAYRCGLPLQAEAAALFGLAAEAVLRDDGSLLFPVAQGGETPRLKPYLEAFYAAPFETLLAHALCREALFVRRDGLLIPAYDF